MRTRTILITLSVLCIIAIPFVTKTNDSKGPGSVRVLRDISYISDKALPAASSQLLDLYVPTKSYPIIPLVVFIHGGAWLQGAGMFSDNSAILPDNDALGIGLHLDGAPHGPRGDGVSGIVEPDQASL